MINIKFEKRRSCAWGKEVRKGKLGIALYSKTHKAPYHTYMVPGWGVYEMCYNCHEKAKKTLIMWLSE